MKNSLTTITLICFCLFTVYGSGLHVYCVEISESGAVCIIEVDAQEECVMMQASGCSESELAPAFIEGVITFYTMYQRTPPGKYLLQVCTTLSCQLCGTSELVTWLLDKLGIGFGETTDDGLFTLLDVQCLGACGEAPVIQINDDFYTNLDVEKLSAILDDLK